MQGYQFARGVGWMIAGRVVSNLLGVVSTLVVAARLAPGEMGIFVLANSLVQIVLAVFELQTSLILIQMGNPSREDFNTVFTISLIRGLVLSVMLLLAAWPYARAFHQPGMVPLLLALSIYPLLLSIRNPYFELHARDAQFLPTTLLEIGTKIGSFVGTVGVVLICPSYWALYAGLVLSAITALAVNFGLSKDVPGFSLRSFSKVFSFSIWLGFAAFVNQSNRQMARLLLGGVFGTALLGAFAMAAQILEQIMNILIQPVNWVSYSSFSKINHDKERLRQTYLAVHAGTGALLLPAAVGLFLVVNDLIHLLLSERWGEAVIFAEFAALATFIRLLAGPAWSLAMSLGETRVLFWRTLVMTFIRLVFQVLGIMFGGLQGFLVSGLVAEAAGCYVTLSLLRKVCGLRRIDVLFAVARPVFACLLMVGSVYALHHQMLLNAEHRVRLLSDVGVGILTYLLASWSIWRVAGQPEGHERRAIELGMHALRIARSRLSSAFV